MVLVVLLCRQCTPLPAVTPAPPRTSCPGLVRIVHPSDGVSEISSYCLPCSPDYVGPAPSGARTLFPREGITMAVVETIGPKPADTIEWVPVEGTRRPGDEMLVGFMDGGLVLRNSLTQPGLALTYEDLEKVAALALPRSRAK